METVVDLMAMDAGPGLALLKRLTANVECQVEPNTPPPRLQLPSPTGEEDELVSAGLSPKLRMCSLCKQTKGNIHFNRSKKQQRGSRYDYYCKLCRDSVRLKSRSRLPNFIKMMHFELCKRSKKRQCEITVTADEIMSQWKRQRGRCALSGTVMTHASTSRHVSVTHTNTNIDRVSGQGAYDRENTQLICGYVVQAKHDISNEHFLRMCADCTDFQRYSHPDGEDAPAEKPGGSSGKDESAEHADATH